MPKGHAALLLVALTASAVAAPRPTKTVDPLERFRSRLAAGRDAMIPELNATVTARSVAGKAYQGVVIKIYDKAGNVREEIRAETAEFQTFTLSSTPPRPVVSLRLGPFVSITATGGALNAPLGGNFDLPWPPQGGTR